MRWISIEYENDMGTKWKNEGWYFDNPTEDYKKRLRCKKCGCVTKINQCEKDELRGYSGDRCGAPVFYLYCSNCATALAVIDESKTGTYLPMLYLEKDGEFEKF